MSRESVERLINVVVTTIPERKTSEVVMMYPAIFRTSCTFDISNFPYDKQECQLIFASWTYDIKSIDYRISLDFYSNQFEIFLLQNRVEFFC